LTKGWDGSDAFSVTGAAPQISLGHRPRNSFAELTSAEGANQLRFKQYNPGALPAGAHGDAWAQDMRRSGDRRSLVAVVSSND